MTKSEFLAVLEIESSPTKFFDLKNELELIPQQWYDLMITIFSFGSSLETLIELDRSMKSKPENKSIISGLDQ